MDTSDNSDIISDLLSAVVEAPLAYVRPIATEKGVSYAVCSADGTQLAVFSTRDAAFFAAKQHDLEPVLIH